MATKTVEYWTERMEQEARRQYQKQERYELGIINQYTRLRRGIQRDLNKFYDDFAVDNKVSRADAEQYLNPRQQAEFRKNAKPMLDRAKIIQQDRWTNELQNAVLKKRISRLDALMIGISDQVRTIARQQYGKGRQMLYDTYEDHYYRIGWLVQRGRESAPFSKLSPELIDRVVKRNWLGSNYSKRHYGDTDKLLRELRNTLVDAFTGGDSLEDLSEALAGRLGVAQYQAERLIRTEANHILNEAVRDAFIRSGVVGYYRLVAIHDSRISKICAAIDGKVFALDDWQVGVNFPPLHPNCRTTISPEFKDQAARDRAKNFIFIPDTTSYSEWLDKIA